MFRIRKIHDDTTAANREAIAQVEAISRAQFPDWRPLESESLTERLRDPLRFRYRSVLLVLESGLDKVRGFALLLHMPDLGIAYLDLISVAPGKTGGGVGAVLYERVREEARALHAQHLFLECSVDNPALVRDEATLQQNIQRLRFYERYDVRPIVNNRYASPVTPGDQDVYFLMVDPLDAPHPLPRSVVREVASAILERRYPHLFDSQTIRGIVESFEDDPVQLREPRYLKAESRPHSPAPAPGPRRIAPIALMVNARHEIHHVRDRGYMEAPVRIPVILDEIGKTGLFNPLTVRHTPERLLRRVHDPAYLHYLERACAQLPAGKSIYPIIFPPRNQQRPPEDIELQVGYYCTDTFTPLHPNVWLAAHGAVDCAYTGAQALLEGYELAYALVRPPGHHAERRSFGGFCYLNSGAVAAEFLSQFGRVAVLDVDFHHGNGTQDIFWERSDVLTVSIHGAPPHAYPHFAGFADEQGAGAGLGYNLNLPLPPSITAERYGKTLDKALRRIRDFAPAHLVVCLGLDTAKADPTGTWPLVARDFQRCGEQIGALKLPTLVVQEGGYRTRTLGINARHFFLGLAGSRG
jgi:acetoin utilization deacetylase AcuC-like enzyme/GNAT superfamily N-acetyltransferase